MEYLKEIDSCRAHAGKSFLDCGFYDRPTRHYVLEDTPFGGADNARWI